MNFQFIDTLRELLNGSNIFQFIIVGAKSFALAMIMFKIIDNFIVNMGSDQQNAKLNNLPSILAYAFFIVSSDWIIDTIESTFSVVDVAMGNTSSDLYTELNMSLTDQYDRITANATDFFDLIAIYASSITFFVFYFIALILMLLCKIADLSVTSGYLLSRLFLITLMKFIFPIVIALSTLKMTEDLLAKWIKRYIGLFVLGIAYIGIINFASLVQKALQDQFTTSAGEGLLEGINSLNVFSVGMLITIIVVFTMKVKLFATATSFITSFFS
jgi:hypothetical protein